MKTKIVIALAILFTSTAAWSQTDTVAIMNAGSNVIVYAKWTGSGNITANGAVLKNSLSLDSSNVIYAINDTVTLIAIGDVREIEVVCGDLVSLTAIGLTKLDCHGAAELDVTRCPELIELVCREGTYTVLDLTQCTKLQELDCAVYDKDGWSHLRGMLTEIDLSQCSELRILFCSRNKLTSLDVSNCPKLVQVCCDQNALNVLNVSNNPNLLSLDCYGNNLSSLDVSNSPELIGLRCDDNQLTLLDVSQCTELRYLDCYSNGITSLDVSNCPKLKELWCSRNLLTSLDIRGCTELEELYASPQTVTLPSEFMYRGSVSIANPIMFNGSPITTLAPNNGGVYIDGNIIWNRLSGTSGTVSFTFNTPEGFSGTAYLPWIKGIINAEGISLNKTELTLEKDREEKLTTTFTPTDATNQQILWESRDEDIATVNSNGFVIGIAEGETYIVATAVDGNYQDSCQVTITPYSGITLPTNTQTTQVYPNPASTETIIFDWGNNAVKQIEIYTLNGNLIDHIKPQAGAKQAEHNIRQYPAGIYLYKTLNEKGITTEGKFIKQ